MPPLRIRMTCSPRPRAAIAEAHSLRAVWLGSLFTMNFEFRISNEEFRRVVNSSFLIRNSKFEIHFGLNVTELTGPSHTVIATTTAFSLATASDNWRWNHCAMFSAEGLMRSNGGTSLMQP